MPCKYCCTCRWLSWCFDNQIMTVILFLLLQLQLMVSNSVLQYLMLSKDLMPYTQYSCHEHVTKKRKQRKIRKASFPEQRWKLSHDVIRATHNVPRIHHLRFLFSERAVGKRRLMTRLATIRISRGVRYSSPMKERSFFSAEIRWHINIEKLVRTAVLNSYYLILY